MTPYHAQHSALFRAVAEILVRDYIAPSETADTVAEWCEKRPITWINGPRLVVLMEPSELAALIAYVEGYERSKMQ